MMSRRRMSANESLESAHPSDSFNVSYSSSSSNMMETISSQNSRVTAVTSKLQWKIDQFERLTRLYRNNKSMVSETFSSPLASNVVWELHIYPNGKREEDVGFVSFFLRQVGLADGEALTADFQIYVVDHTDRPSNVCRDCKDFTHQQGRGKFQVERDRLLQCLKLDGSLYVCCEVEYLPMGICKSDEERPPWEFTDKTSARLKETLRRMYDESILTDLEIQVGSKSFQAHKAVLAQASSVFRSMFSINMKESTEGILTIPDSTPAAIATMLDYLYCGVVDQGAFEKHTVDILVLSQKYDVPGLKEEAEKILSTRITAKNFTEYLDLADVHECSRLIAECRHFLITNYEEIVASSDWMALKKTNPELINKVLEKVVEDRIVYPSRALNSFRSLDYSDSTRDHLGPPLPKRPRRRCVQ
ncbi:unnamed protein product [Bursaphelenchus xylophilus]|uniref:(pine wood nematode) hypothetical protein n=1 Tax=Bursaphelenchus xylophilus TaxID=6326 RepID=A0A1I7RX12_BURXY|nr:unnamed protein product [Bursaphelenchus xylophilus]CAG9121256.1 unnamed protein product [Bursaphelenchus xylophilus]